MVYATHITEITINPFLFYASAVEHAENDILFEYLHNPSFPSV